MGERISTPDAGSRLLGRLPVLPAVLVTLVALVYPAHAQAAAPQTAYELLRKEAERTPGLGRSGEGGVASLSVVAVSSAVGGVAWALAPHYQHWGPQDPEQGTGYGVDGALIGGLQALCEMVILIPSATGESARTRDEFNAVLDELDPVARERLAARALERLARRNRNLRVIALAWYLGLSGLSVGAYYAGENMIGRNPNAERIGPGYVATLAVGTAIFGWLRARGTTPLENAYGGYLRSREHKE